MIYARTRPARCQRPRAGPCAVAPDRHALRHDGRWSLRLHRERRRLRGLRTLRRHELECLVHGALELRIAPLHNESGVLQHLDVRVHALALGDEPVRSEHRACGCGDRPAVHERVRHRRVDQPAPRARADEWADVHLPEHPREEVATRARELVRDEHLRARYATDREVHATHARDVVRDAADELLAHHRHHVVVEESTAVEPLVDHRALAILLRKVVAIEGGDGRPARVRYPHVRELPAREGVHPPTIVLDPGALAELRLGADRNDRHVPRAIAARALAQAEHGLALRGAIERIPRLVARGHRYAVHLQEVITHAGLHAWRVEWRPQPRVPALAGVDARDPPALTLSHEVG